MGELWRKALLRGQQGTAPREDPAKGKLRRRVRDAGDFARMPGEFLRNWRRFLRMREGRKTEMELGISRVLWRF